VSVTLADLVAEVESFTYSYFNDRDKVTSLTGAISDTDLTLPLAEAHLVDRGYVEIDYELIAVKSKNDSTGTVQVHPWGRGERGTVAAAHASGARVAINPRFPRSWMRAEINTAVANLYPDLFAVATTTANTTSPAVLTYPLPADAEGVLQVSVDTVGPTRLWQPVQRFWFNYTANTAEFPNGKSLTLLNGFTPGQTIQVVYRKQFGELVSDTDTLAAIGCDDSWRDLIKLQVAARMIMALDSARLNSTTVEASNRANQVPVGSSVQIARQLLAQYNQRLESERQLLLNRYPTPTILR
jgi:hypothetical protein